MPGRPLARNKSTNSQETSAPAESREAMTALAALRCPPPVSEMINKIYTGLENLVPDETWEAAISGN